MAVNSPPPPEGSPPVAQGGGIDEWPPPGHRMVRVAGALAVVSVLTALASFVTGPLQARALGPSGRGDLAAIVVPLTLAPQILAFATGAFVAREAARGRSPGLLVGSVGAVMLAVGGLGAVAAVPLAHFFAGDRHVVQTFLTIGFALLPLSLVGGVVFALLGGLGRWRLLVVTRMVPFVTGLVGIVTLYAVGELTVASAAIVTLVGGLLALVPLLALRGVIHPIVARAAVAREGLAFGLRTWVGGLASLANARFDQLLMIRLVSPSELGFYAVAVTISGASLYATGGLGPPLGRRVAAGERHLAADAVRMTLGLAAALGAAVALATPFALPLLFGQAFSDAIDMTLVLLAASVPLAGATILGTILVSDGAPTIPSIGEGVALAVTVPGLIVLLPSLGGLGAALVSLAAYSLNFGVQLIMARGRLGGSWRSYLVPHAGDVRRAVNMIRHR